LFLAVKIHISTIRKIINLAVDKGYTASLPVANYPMLKETRKKHAFLSPEEIRALIENILDDLTKKRVLFGVLTGISPAELWYLIWNDVDFYTNTVKIQGKKDWRPKTKVKRIIPLCYEASQILKELFEKRKNK